MKIYLEYFLNTDNSRNENWIYFGKNFSNLNYLEERIGKKKKVSLTKEIVINFSNQKKNFLNWLNKQNKYFKNSIYWWMNGLASKNNLSVGFFLNIAQLISIKNFLKKNNSDIRIICENYHLMKELVDNLEANYNLKKPNFFYLKLQKEKIFFFFEGVLNHLKIIYYFISNYYYAFITRNKKNLYPKKEVYLFHDLVNSENFKKKLVQSRYFGNYPKWLKEKKKNVITLPWFYKRIKNKKKLYKNLREINSFIPEDFLSFFDYYKSVKNSIKSVFKINNLINFPNIKINNLIEIEKFNSFKSKSAIFFLYIPAFKKWAKKIKSLTLFTHHQNQIYEFALIHAIKSVGNLNVKIIGYYHSMHSINFLPYYTNNNEWESSFKPNLIICPNEVSKKNLVYLGNPRKKIKIISDLQRDTLKISNKKNRNYKKNLLIILSLFPDSNYELLKKLFEINKYLSKFLKLNVMIRSHPYINKKNLMKSLKWKNLPYKWKWTNDSLEKNLLSTKCVITMHSAVVTDALLFNCYTIILKSELGVAENYLDFIKETECSLLKTVDFRDLKQNLHSIYTKDKMASEKEVLKIHTLLKSTHYDRDNYKNIINI